VRPIFKGAEKVNPARLLTVVVIAEPPIEADNVKVVVPLVAVIKYVVPETIPV
jgi:hypothetical protein